MKIYRQSFHVGNRTNTKRKANIPCRNIGHLLFLHIEKIRELKLHSFACFTKSDYFIEKALKLSYLMMTCCWGCEVVLCNESE